MPIYYTGAAGLIPDDEWIAQPSEVHHTLGAAAKRSSTKLPDLTPPALLRTGKAQSVLAGGEDFQPTGVGRPLALWITSAYAGELGGTFWKGSRSVLVSSAIKSWVTPDAQPRALNIVKRDVKKGELIGLPAATEPGTPLIFYSPAAIDRRLTLTVEIAFDDVNEDMLAGLSRVFDAAGGLPVFAAATPYLLAASSLFKLGGALGNRLFDNRAEFSATERLTLSIQDGTGYAGYVVMTRSPLEKQALDGHIVSNEGILVNAKTGATYTGDVPHVVIAMDGRADPSFEKFSASAVSAAMLQKFYNVRENGESDAKHLVDALTLYNDFRYSTEASTLKQAIASASGQDKQALQLRYDALLKNIKDEKFKVK